MPVHEIDVSPVFGSKASAGGPSTERTVRDLFEEYHASIWRLLRRLGVDSASLDDGTQEVFWVAVRRLDDIEQGKEHSFLYGVALRVAANYRRVGASIRVVESYVSADAHVDPSPSPEHLAEGKQARELLDRVLDSMSPELRSVLVLSVLEELSLKEIAEIEGVLLGTATSRLRRAREEFSKVVRRMQAVESRGGQF